MAGGSPRTRRAELQAALGALGEVHPRRARGDEDHPAAGWYATIAGELVFLGDHTHVAFVTIARHKSEAQPV